MKIPGKAAVLRVLRQVAWSSVVPNTRRGRILEQLGHPYFSRGLWAPNTAVMSPASVTVEDHVFVNEGCFFDSGSIHLETGVYLGPRVVLVTANHSLGPEAMRAGGGKHSFIHIGQGSWLGAGVIVLPGVTIGAGCVIAAGAVVTKDCEPNGLYAGVPAKRVKELPHD